ncbi:hypothetical protein COCC4DRAFT_148691 [Bipolaris maydis ATCC 48331]|uniref:Uncharacterized protein n=2 Tax=Cochliobolus heterostrophus TaxID=5016 RepID=M2V3D0_COCH5|nr:uncharacterized protein COCC4DRAFT_148691 [Bipolaris maydis ATCC 48331]EMD94528.1 hypothetical protein COCHEDRAFT_1153802 [Bipolaris maydis C5]KAJ5026341.1 hypothetical protein J3E73DRAFT_189067 [Bipolaris maydis]ENI01128.1 hypothetical protein COCC4DRAFT_148691 [Bipolaris maydis ATCC 48331]KAJ6209941.1 hypothetical protein PSV09DRAFT_1153802 [Bipolaris maydis]KAJ6271096.1 hypothetical protein PSV08DRAFT_179432 [Bipolaris maydis]
MNNWIVFEPAYVEPTLRGLELFINCVFKPLITAPLLSILLYSLKDTGKYAEETMIFSRLINKHSLMWTLSFLTTVGIIRKANPLEIAVVTRGCNRIGRAIAEALTRHRICVAVLNVQAPPKAFKSNSLLTYFRCDISSPIAIAETADKIRNSLGHPSILVNNAGIVHSAHTILRTLSKFLSRIFDTNILSHWRLIQQFVLDMVAKNKGHIVSVASIASYLTSAANVDYATTKAAALAFHEGLTTSGVKTTIVHPSWVRTPAVKEGVLSSGQDAKILEDFLLPEEVAEFIIRQIISRRGAHIFIPSFGAPISGLRG